MTLRLDCSMVTASQIKFKLYETKRQSSKPLSKLDMAYKTCFILVQSNFFMEEI